MHKLEGHIKELWFIFSNSDNTVYRYSSSCGDCVTESGLPNVETFEIKEEWLVRLNELGLTPPESDEIIIP